MTRKKTKNKGKQDEREITPEDELRERKEQGRTERTKTKQRNRRIERDGPVRHRLRLCLRTRGWKTEIQRIERERRRTNIQQKTNKKRWQKKSKKRGGVNEKQKQRGE
jgi:hypothetical protein